MKEDYVSFEIAKKLKEKGFREECLSYYNKIGRLAKNGFTAEDGKYLEYDNFYACQNHFNALYDAPTIAQVLKWLREVHKIHILIEYVFSEDTEYSCEVQLIGSYERYWPNGVFETYEQSAIAGIEYALDNLI